MSRHYYNEHDPYAAQWLRNLVSAGLIPAGDVDDRTIIDVRPSDLSGYVQCHFFAGIAGWPLALAIAGWPVDRPIWTGSCPCQPFSVAGKGLGTDDVRHLWPDFLRLIRSVRPPVVMGEQVAGAAGYGWLDGVVSDLAREGYAGRGVDIPACAVDAPHIRSRLYWIARDMADRDGGGRAHERIAGLQRPEVHDAHGRSERGDKADAGREQRFGRAHERGPHVEGAPIGREEGVHDQRRSGRNGTFWSDAIWLTGADGKARRAQPGLPLLAHGVPGRVGKLRAFGNAIVPPLAAEVISAFMEAAE